MGIVSISLSMIMSKGWMSIDRLRCSDIGIEHGELDTGFRDTGDLHRMENLQP